MLQDLKTRPTMSFKKKIVLFFLFLLTINCSLLFTCGFVFALEQAYPEIEGINLEKVTQKATPLPKVIKYFTTWAIIIALAMVLGALIYSGLIYLTSTGKPGKQAEAKKKVKQGFLGLAILAVSYLALAFVNPELTILKIERKVVETGVVLLTKPGYEALKDPNNSLSVMDLVDENLAFILELDSPDLKVQLGPLVVEEWANPPQNNVVKKVNFGEVPLFGFLFWGKLANEVRVLAFPLANHQLPENQPNVKVLTYDKGGKVQADGLSSTGAEIISKGGLEMSFIQIDYFELNQTLQFAPITVENYKTLDSANKAKLNLEERNVLSPPLSLAIKKYEPGVYLSSLANVELFLKQSENDLGKRNFSQKASYLRLQNSQSVIINGEDGDHFGGRYFAVLFAEKDQKGQTKVFFPELNPDNLANTAIEFHQNGSPLTTENNYHLNNFFAVNNTLRQTPNEEAFDSLIALASEATYQEMMEKLRFTNELTRGNILENKTTKIYPTVQERTANPEIDKYGLVEKVESIGIWQFSERLSACDKVALCTEPGGTNGKGDCLVYLNPNNPDFLTLKPRQAIYPMPFFEPTSLPKAYVYSPEIKTAGMKDTDLAFVLVDFSDKIKSIEVSPQGGCLVGLFENKTPFSPSNQTGMTRFFHKSVMDLKGDPIDRCGSIFSLNKYTSQSCASSIVVYPIIPDQLASAHLAQGVGSGDNTGFSSQALFMYNSNDVIAKVETSLKRFDANLVSKLTNKIKNSAVINLSKQFITLKNGSTENIDPCLFVQMMVIQESLGNLDACGKDKGPSVGCGLMQYKCDSPPRSCASCSNCLSGGSSKGNMLGLSGLENNISRAITDKLVPYLSQCGSSAQNLSCNVAKNSQFWPYFIINYNAGPGANKPSVDCKEPCSFYANHQDGGCFLPPSLQAVAYPNKVECPIRRNDYNITYKYVLSVRDGYSYLRQLQTAGKNLANLATCR